MASLPEPDPLLDALGRRIRILRLRDGMTVRALAARASLSPRFLMDVEAGRGNISVRRLAAIAAALDTTLADLVATAPTAGAARPILALLGVRGAGKTSIGRRLAKRLKVPFVELDTLVAERAGLALGEIFSLYGEDYYRRLEREVLRELLVAARPTVMAVGGGLVTSADAFALLREHTRTVWLRARPVDYWNRVMRQGDQRPMNEHPQAREALKALVAQREPMYRQADMIVDTARLTVAESVDRILTTLESGP